MAQKWFNPFNVRIVFIRQNLMEDSPRTELKYL